MSIDNNNEQLNSENQLDLFAYNTSKLDFLPDLEIPPARPPQANKSPRFMTMSAALHIAAAVAVAIMSVPLVNEIKTETITIDLEEPAKVHQVTKGADVEPTMGGEPSPILEKAPVKNIAKELPTKTVEAPTAPTEAPVEAAATAEEPAVVAAPAIEKSEPIAQKVVLPPPTKPAPPKPAAKAVHKAVQSAPAKTNFAAVPMTIDDINSPELDEGEIANQKSQAKLGEDFNQDFDEIDNKHSNKLAAEHSQLNAMADALAADQESSLKSLEDQNQADAAALAESQKNLRNKNAKAIAAAVAAERAAAAAAAREKAQKEAAALAAANEAASGKGGNGLGGDGSGNGEKKGAGAGNNGADKNGTEVAGAATGVRSLDQLKQMPGNPRPQYNEDERLRGDQGKVSFEAYITKDGIPVNFKMKQSTGHRNLDAKTLAALKKWRFYPGQEGWVEMPFSWDLKGGVQEVKGRLRTSVGQLQGGGY
ncbi:energy transducer TonB [Bdellovibrio sp. SKB1291214]|uniref:energy transducer TonB n=1 Tax=Bdellovibrio sp. SKB1291214 TaxID=1732569 RepID=UPI000B514C1B|nr:energy transducer TonB [Bdellovibrio sp. SKB1291214]UYL10672.1 energy transducer TonB [Bdellovibrio sp. SKB1291214]